MTAGRHFERCPGAGMTQVVFDLLLLALANFHALYLFLPHLNRLSLKLSLALVVPLLNSHLLFNQLLRLPFPFRNIVMNQFKGDFLFYFSDRFDFNYFFGLAADFVNCDFFCRAPGGSVLIGRAVDLLDVVAGRISILKVLTNPDQVLLPCLCVELVVQRCHLRVRLLFLKLL